MNKLIFSFIILAFPALMYANPVYQWTDEDGQTHYSDSIPENQKTHAKKVELPDTQVTEAQRQAAQARTARIKAWLQQNAAKPVESTELPSAPAPSETSVPKLSECDEAWKKYDESFDCFEPFRVVGGGVRPEAFKYCTEVARPDRTCPRPARIYDRRYIAPPSSR